MVDLPTLYLRNHRNQQYLLVGGAFAALLCSLAPRNERALFVLGDGPAPKAFAAFAPPPAFNGLFDNGGQGGRPVYRFRAPPRRFGPGGQGSDGLSPITPAEVAPGGGGVPDVGRAPLELASLDPGGPGLPGAPLAGSGPQTFGPASGPTGAVNPTAPAGPGSPVGPGSPGTPSTPVAPVPEPATWALLILGFFGIGAALRLGARSVQFKAIAFELDRLESRKRALAE